MRESELVLRFVRSIGRPAEAEYYLSLFRSERRESFAVIAVSDAVMGEAAEALAVDLRLLARLDLVPVVVFGLVDPTRAADHAAYVRGALAPEIACAITSFEEAGAVARGGGLPLIAVGAEQPGSIDGRFDALATMARGLHTHKVVFLGRRSGLQPSGKPPPSLVDLTREYDALSAALPANQASLLRQIRRLIDAVPHRMTVAVTSPLDLLRELFTVRGAGTLVRRSSQVTLFSGYGELDRDRLEALINAAFGAALAPGFWERPVESIYIADDYRGAAVLSDTKLAPYLTKFAVDAGARGEGIGGDLWRAITRDHARLFWRARADNPIGPWYQQNCDGMLRGPRWHVYWRGLDPAEIEAAVNLAREAPIDLIR